MNYLLHLYKSYLSIRSILLFSIYIFSLIPSIDIIYGQTVIVPGPEVDDPFKNNPKWQEFLLTQVERVERLRTLVNNVWTLIDSIPNPSPKTHLNESFVKFLVPDFIDFFKETNERLRDGNPFPFINTAIGFHNMSFLLNFSTITSNLDTLTHLRLRWIVIGEAAQIVHNVFNKTSTDILKYKNNFQRYLTDDIAQERYPLWSSKILQKNSKDHRNYSLDELASTIDTEMQIDHGGHHLFRGLLQLIFTMKQSYTDTNQFLNFFCYGNNEFGVIPHSFDIIADAGTYLVMADMKKLILDVYFITLDVFFNSNNERVKVKETIGRRSEIWMEMIGRIKRKINFPFLDGRGWDHPAGPIVFKCDLPPKNVLGDRSQWGRNISTGISPGPSPTFPYDPPAGPLKHNNTVGYIDERRPDFLVVGYDQSFQGYIESELALNPTSSCRETCSVFKRMTPLCENTPHHCPLYRKSHCRPKELDPSQSCMTRNQCPHYAMKCLRTGKEVKMCPSINPKKLYDWISFNGRVIGMKSLNDEEEPLCKGGNVTIATERWEMENGVILHTPRYCELCLCTCMTPLDPSNHGYFDLHPLVTNVNQGMIVSAIRFVKEGNVIRLAIEEGKPLMKGLIEETTTRWIEGTSSSSKSKTVEMGINGFLRVNFDLIIGQAGTVVTGIRFKFNSTEKSINLEVQTTPIEWPEQDANAISLKSSESTWIGSRTTSRETLEFKNPDDPVKQKGPSMPDSVLNSFVEFTSSSYETDLGQTVIPLFDAQPVFYYEGRRWLRGIGIMHKGKPGFGGFITPSIVPATPYKSIHFHPVPTNDTVFL